MGNTTSEACGGLLRAPVTEPSKPIARVDARFCSSTAVTLHLKDKFWSLSGDDFTICDVQTGQVYFRIRGSDFSLSERKALLDENYVAIAHMREAPFTLTNDLFNVYADADSKKFLFTIESTLSVFSSVLKVNFLNQVTGMRCKMGLEGDWRARNAVIWLDAGEGRFIVVARVTRAATTGRSILLGKHDYYVEIAPNVDLALIVLICVAMDESSRD
ncbi:hypothetical protein Poli38472_013363 [Pythium oligandrum]|uniref:Uncharacterized protein n=1 Tax=Pythium oligandrum TaxID=41045 RepID=A0A8K1C7H9_PYTOL|nr:hypothetical protein Poli38472_013363 [Pythium oligandrum]|eukprot:TMW57889.1 hypothetical protein Poli38472_013363 [Pythium oligandrum]